MCYPFEKPRWWIAVVKVKGGIGWQPRMSSLVWSGSVISYSTAPPPSHPEENNRGGWDGIGWICLPEGLELPVHMFLPSERFTT